ncbi:hypothetical protein Q3G72_026165 [Acer saccharum]|nr:hypothetical protein Q3G72_026165 [Acer saccharum]
MEVVAAILGSAVAVGQSLCGSFPSIKNFISFQSNLTTLEKKMENLVDLKNKVIEDVDFSSDAEMARWLQEVEQILLEVNSVPTGITAHNGKLCGCFLNCSERYRLSKETARMLKEIERLLKAGDIAVKMVGRNYLAKAVEHIPGPSIVNQTTASQNLAKVMDLLNDDEVTRIGVWGMGGVGGAAAAGSDGGRWAAATVQQRWRPAAVVVRQRRWRRPVVWWSGDRPVFPLCGRWWAVPWRPARWWPTGGGRRQALLCRGGGPRGPATGWFQGSVGGGGGEIGVCNY